MTYYRLKITKSEMFDLIRKGHTEKKDELLLEPCEFVDGELIATGEVGYVVDYLEVE